MSRFAVFLFVFMQAVLSATSQAQESSTKGIDTDLLLNGHPSVGELPRGAPVTGRELFTLSSKMRRYLDRVAIGNSPVERLNTALRDMKRRNFQLEYDLNKTASAAEAFAERRGNCVSFAAMIVSMARELGVEARLNQAVVPTSRKITASTDGQGYVQNVMHINAVVISDNKPYVVEQDFRIFAGKYLSELDDAAARAIYLNNLAMEAMGRNELPEAFLLSREAIKLDDDASYLWNSLGTVYRRAGALELAKMSYNQALKLNSQDKMAQRNLMRVDRALEKSKSGSDLKEPMVVDA